MNAEYMEKFQSTRPSRDGTWNTEKTYERRIISIHPPLAGRDPRPRATGPRLRNFNPPAPRGTGHHGASGLSAFLRFQSTRPSRDGTRCRRDTFHRGLISIHPPLAGRDSNRVRPKNLWLDFNPPAPRGTGLKITILPGLVCNFNPPAPRGTGHTLFRIKHK